MNSARKHLRTAIELSTQSEERAISAVITELKIAMISIKKNELSRDPISNLSNSTPESTNQDIHIKLDKIIEKLDEQKVETNKISPVIPQMTKNLRQMMTNQKRHVIMNPNIIPLPQSVISQARNRNLQDPNIKNVKNVNNINVNDFDNTNQVTNTPT